MHLRVDPLPEASETQSPAWGPRRVAFAALGLWLLTGLYMVGADEQAVTTIFGAISNERVTPGVHYNAPWPLGSVYKLKVRQTQRAVVGGELADTAVGQADPLLAQFLTGDQNIIHVRTIVQYSIAAPTEYLFLSQEPDPIVRDAVEAELARQIGARTVDEALTTEKAAIQGAVRVKAQALIDQYGLGVVIASINIESASAPPEAADAFRDVAGARADASRIVNEAEGYANDIVPRARGEARRLLEQAGGYRSRKVDEASGDAARFSSLAAEYRRNPEVTRNRLYLETMDEVLPRLNKTVIDDASALDLTIVRRKAASEQP